MSPPAAEISFSRPDRVVHLESSLQEANPTVLISFESKSRKECCHQGSTYAMHVIDQVSRSLALSYSTSTSQLKVHL